MFESPVTWPHARPIITSRAETQDMSMDRRGGMPFAVIAVALLLASTALAAMVHQYSETADDAGGALEGINDADTAVADIQV